MKAKKKKKHTLDQVRARLDQLSDVIVELTKAVNELKFEIKNIDVRLDYNNLKRLPENNG